MPIPDTLYAKVDDAAIAYQIFGSGEHRVVAVPGLIGNVGLIWEWPPYHHFFERWGNFATVAQFDQRGTGASDRVESAASTEEGMEDFQVVMDAVGWERATIYGLSDGGPLACQFAATYPERVEKLILHGTFARLVRGDGYDIGVERADHDRFLTDWAAQSGTHENVLIPVFAPSQMGDEGFLRWMRRAERLSGRPRDLLASMSLNAEIDVREVLARIRVPTLVVHARQDQAYSVDHGRYLAANIPGAPPCSNTTASTSRGSSAWTRAWTQSSGSLPAQSAVRPPIGCSPRCCSRTSAGRRSGRQRSATTTGGHSSTVTTTTCGLSSLATAASK
jgi:pimeloyl-ACP methyl ester carboxylesterase